MDRRERPPVVAAWGVGVNSTAMLVELWSAGQPPDVVLTADTGGEKPETYAYRDMFMGWLADRGIEAHVVRATTSRFKNWPPYRNLEEACLTNGTLPSISYGGSSCSVRWKIQPQEAWVAKWPPAIEAWARGQKVVKLIGYDVGPRDSKRYAQQASIDDPRYECRYPLQVLGWDRAACEDRIKAEGLPVPVKSACFYCGSSRPAEIDGLPTPLLRRIVAMEARATPRLTAIDGLWRKPVKGMRGAVARPGSMTEYIRDHELLPAAEIDRIRSAMPTALAPTAADGGPGTDEGDRAEWAAALDALGANEMAAPGIPAPYGKGTR